MPFRLPLGSRNLLDDLVILVMEAGRRGIRPFGSPIGMSSNSKVGLSWIYHRCNPTSASTASPILHTCTDCHRLSIYTPAGLNPG